MSLYADTSLLISYYINDSNSATAQAVIHATTEPLIFTGLHRLEIRNALALGIFRRILKSSQINAAWTDIERDLRKGLLNPQHVNWGPIFRAAAQSAAFHCPVVGCRSLDILHVTLAKSVNAKEFLTFDTRQKSLAVAQGMTVKP